MDNISSKEAHKKSAKISKCKGRGWAKKRLKRHEGVIADLTKAIKLDPNDSPAYGYRGTSRFVLKDYEGAISDFTKAIEFNPLDYEAFQSRGRARYLLGDVQGAKQDVEKAKELAFEQEDLHAYELRNKIINEIMFSSIKSKVSSCLLYEYEGEISDFTKIIKLNPNDKFAHANRGIFKLNNFQDYQGARHDLEKAKKLAFEQGDLRAYKKFNIMSNEITSVIAADAAPYDDIDF